MQAWRTSRSLIHALWIGFLLAWGGAVAAPVLSQQPMQWVCTASGGLQSVPQQTSGDEAPVVSGHAPDCPLCLLGGALPPRGGAVWAGLRWQQPLPSHGGKTTETVSRVTPPMPPRGPPPTGFFF